MNINEMFPSKYLRAADLQGMKVPVTISGVSMTEFEDNGKKESKAVIHFEGKEKGMVMNKTNAMTIAAAYGDDTDNWPGQKVILYSAKVNFGGEMKDALRVELPQAMAEETEAPF